jgi:hypothetical protein
VAIASAATDGFGTGAIGAFTDPSLLRLPNMLLRTPVWLLLATEHAHKGCEARFFAFFHFSPPGDHMRDL